MIQPRNPNITVAPGVIIEFTEDTDLTVNENSSFDATGTEEESIQLTI